MLGNWNRILVEISQGQPFELGDGFAAARVWVNENVTPRVGFGDFAAGKYPVTDGNNAALDICGPFDPTTPNKVSQTWLGYYDVLNFVWIEGAQNLFQDTSSKFHSERLKIYFNCTDANSILTTFSKLSDPQAQQYWDLKCASGAYLQDGVSCVMSPSNDSYFLHSPTNSYQSNYISKGFI